MSRDLQNDNTNTQQENQAYFKICRNIAIPPVTRRCKWTLLVDQMREHDSVLVPNYHQKVTLCKALNNRGFKATTRKSSKGYRIWKGGAL